jgi:hypothetical protein
MVAFIRSLDFRTFAASITASHDWKATVQTTENSTSAFRIARTIRIAVRPHSQQMTAHAIRTRGV